MVSAIRTGSNRTMVPLPVRPAAPVDATHAQTGVNVLPCRYPNDGRSGFLRLRNNAELLLGAPAASAFPCTRDFDRAMRHDFKVDLKVGFKVILGVETVKGKAAVTGWLPRSGWPRLKNIGARRAGVGVRLCGMD
jgi:hypothetical protein